MSGERALRAYQKPGRPPCSIDGCGRAKYARQMCVMHYSRAMTRGDVGTAGRERVPAGSGHVNPDGYRVIRAPGHPVATAQGKALEHRVVLYDAIGIGPHPCHWCGVVLPWSGGAGRGINVDHLDDNRLNNTRDNLVPSCLDCNTKRGAA